LDRVVEKLVAVKTNEVFWDPSSAGYPRIMAQKCVNRHGNFLMIEEFVGRRSGPIMIPEGRRGQGWARLKMEVSRANSSLGVAREKHECKKATVGRSYAEVVMEAQVGGSEESTMNSRNNKPPARTVDGFKTELIKEKQASMVGDENCAAAGEGGGKVYENSCQLEEVLSL
jgi:hypothetical protein